ncbi:serine/arginine repetitive matrix protein 2-like [Asparagus officinalis]|uniref:serine/arginine repetitive matrix protein 2-like n=1 Tax=Asparagus officinalis TaxID=4686 RepID=UPI00098E2E89|nr:serine/arginine repetitive matrix protein 2-like [Asparagus officinalis]
MAEPGDSSEDVHGDSFNNNDFMPFPTTMPVSRMQNGEKPCLGMKFSSHEEAYNYYNSYALMMGFGIRKSSVNYSQKDKQVLNRKFVCDKEGYRSNKDKRDIGKYINHRRETRVGCKAMMRIKLLEDKTWEVVGFIEDHTNHMLSSPDKAKMHRSQQQFHRSKRCKKIIQCLQEEGITPSTISRVINATSGREDESVTPQQCIDYMKTQRHNNIGLTSELPPKPPSKSGRRTPSPNSRRSSSWPPSKLRRRGSGSDPPPTKSNRSHVGAPAEAPLEVRSSNPLPQLSTLKLVAPIEAPTPRIWFRSPADQVSRRSSRRSPPRSPVVEPPPPTLDAQARGPHRSSDAEDLVPIPRRPSLTGLTSELPPKPPSKSGRRTPSPNSRRSSSWPPSKLRRRGSGSDPPPTKSNRSHVGAPAEAPLEVRSSNPLPQLSTLKLVAPIEAPTPRIWFRSPADQVSRRSSRRSPPRSPVVEPPPPTLDAQARGPHRSSDAEDLVPIPRRPSLTGLTSELPPKPPSKSGRRTPSPNSRRSSSWPPSKLRRRGSGSDPPPTKSNRSHVGAPAEAPLEVRSSNPLPQLSTLKLVAPIEAPTPRIWFRSPADQVSRRSSRRSPPRSPVVEPPPPTLDAQARGPHRSSDAEDLVPIPRRPSLTGLTSELPPKPPSKSGRRTPSPNSRRSSSWPPSKLRRRGSGSDPPPTKSNRSHVGAPAEAPLEVRSSNPLPQLSTLKLVAPIEAPTPRIWFRSPADQVSRRSSRRSPPRSPVVEPPPPTLDAQARGPHRSSDAEDLVPIPRRPSLTGLTSELPPKPPSKSGRRTPSPNSRRSSSWPPSKLRRRGSGSDPPPTKSNRSHVGAPAEAPLEVRSSNPLPQLSTLKLVAPIEAPTPRIWFRSPADQVSRRSSRRSPPRSPVVEPPPPTLDAQARGPHRSSDAEDLVPIPRRPSLTGLTSELPPKPPSKSGRRTPSPNSRRSSSWPPSKLRRRGSGSDPPPTKSNRSHVGAPAEAPLEVRSSNPLPQLSTLKLVAPIEAPTPRIWFRSPADQVSRRSSRRSPPRSPVVEPPPPTLDAQARGPHRSSDAEDLVPIPRRPSLTGLTSELPPKPPSKSGRRTPSPNSRRSSSWPPSKLRRRGSGSDPPPTKSNRSHVGAPAEAPLEVRSSNPLPQLSTLKLVAPIEAPTPRIWFRSPADQVSRRSSRRSPPRSPVVEPPPPTLDAQARGPHRSSDAEDLVPIPRRPSLTGLTSELPPKPPSKSGRRTPSPNSRRSSSWPPSKLRRRGSGSDPPPTKSNRSHVGAPAEAPLEVRSSNPLPQLSTLKLVAPIEAPTPRIWFRSPADQVSRRSSRRSPPRSPVVEPPPPTLDAQARGPHRSSDAEDLVPIPRRPSLTGLTSELPPKPPSKSGRRTPSPNSRRSSSWPPSKLRRRGSGSDPPPTKSNRSHVGAPAEAPLEVRSSNPLPQLSTLKLVAPIEAPTPRIWFRSPADQVSRRSSRRSPPRSPVVEPPPPTLDAQARGPHRSSDAEDLVPIPRRPSLTGLTSELPPKPPSKSGRRTPSPNSRRSSSWPPSKLRRRGSGSDPPPTKSNRSHVGAPAEAPLEVRSSNPLPQLSTLKLVAPIEAPTPRIWFRSPADQVSRRSSRRSPPRSPVVEPPPPTLDAQARGPHRSSDAEDLVPIPRRPSLTGLTSELPPKPPSKSGRRTPSPNSRRSSSWPPSKLRRRGSGSDPPPTKSNRSHVGAPAEAPLEVRSSNPLPQLSTLKLVAPIEAPTPRIWFRSPADQVSRRSSRRSPPRSPVVEPPPPTLDAQARGPHRSSDAEDLVPIPRRPSLTGLTSELPPKPPSKSGRRTPSPNSRRSSSWPPSKLRRRGSGSDPPPTKSNRSHVGAPAEAPLEVRSSNPLPQLSTLKLVAPIEAPTPRIWFRSPADQVSRRSSRRSPPRSPVVEPPPPTLDAQARGPHRSSDAEDLVPIPRRPSLTGLTSELPPKPPSKSGRRTPSPNSRRSSSWPPSKLRRRGSGSDPPPTKSNRSHVGAPAEAPLEVRSSNPLPQLSTLKLVAPIEAPTPRIWFRSPADQVSRRSSRRSPPRSPVVEPPPPTLDAQARGPHRSSDAEDLVPIPRRPSLTGLTSELPPKPPSKSGRRTPSPNSRRSSSWPPSKLRRRGSGSDPPPTKSNRSHVGAPAEAPLEVRSSNPLPQLSTLKLVAPIEAPTPRIWFRSPADQVSRRSSRRSPPRSPVVEPPPPTLDAQARGPHRSSDAEDLVPIPRRPSLTGLTSELPPKPPSKSGRRTPSPNSRRSSSWPPSKLRRRGSGSDPPPTKSNRSHVGAPAEAPLEVRSSNPLPQLSTLKLVAPIEAPTPRIWFRSPADQVSRRSSRRSPPRSPVVEPPPPTLDAQARGPHRSSDAEDLVPIPRRPSLTGLTSELPPKPPSKSGRRTPSPNSRRSSSWPPSKLRRRGSGSDPPPTKSNRSHVGAPAEAPLEVRSSNPLPQLSTLKLVAPIEAPTPRIWFRSPADQVSRRSSRRSPPRSPVVEPPPPTLDAQARGPHRSSDAEDLVPIPRRPSLTGLTSELPPKPPSKSGRRTPSPNSRRSSSWPPSKLRRRGSGSDPPPTKSNRSHVGAPAEAPLEVRSSNPLPQLSTLKLVAPIEAPTPRIWFRSPADQVSRRSSRRSPPRSPVVEPPPPTLDAQARGPHRSSDAEDLVPIPRRPSLTGLTSELPPKPPSKSGRRTPSPNSRRSSSWPPSKLRRRGSGSDPPPTKSNRSHVGAPAEAPLEVRSSNPLPQLSTLKLVAPIEAPTPRIWFRSPADQVSRRSSRRSPPRSPVVEPPPPTLDAQARGPHRSSDAEDLVPIPRRPSLTGLTSELPPKPPSKSGRRTPSPNSRRSSSWPPSKLRRRGSGSDPPPTKSNSKCHRNRPLSGNNDLKGSKKTSEPKFPKEYSFKEYEVPAIFKYLLNNNKIKFPSISNKEEAKRTTEPKYYAFHKRVHHPIKICYTLKDKIQALIDVSIITTKQPKEKKVGANVVSISFGFDPPSWFQPESVLKICSKMNNGWGPHPRRSPRVKAKPAALPQQSLRKMMKPRRGVKKEIVFGKGEKSPPSNLFSKEDSNDEKPGPHLFKYGPKACNLMEKWGYDFTLGKGFCFGRGPRVPTKVACVPKGKPDNYYGHRRGLDSDVSLGEVFKGLMSNMATVDPITMEEDDQLPTGEDPWIHHLNIQYGDRFDQREPPTEDKVVQVNMDDEANPNLIFVSLPPDEKEELIALIREYIDVFAQNYENMLGLDLNVAVHRLNIKPYAKPIKQQQR